MPRSLTAYLKCTDVPPRKALQRAVDELDFGLTLDIAYAPFEMAGYLPCTLNGEDAGFDLWFKTADPASHPELQPQIGDLDTVMLCKWGGDPREAASAFIVCAALAKVFNAVVREGASDTLLSYEQLLEKAKTALASR